MNFMIKLLLEQNIIYIFSFPTFEKFVIKITQNRADSDVKFLLISQALKTSSFTTQLHQQRCMIFSYFG